MKLSVVFRLFAELSGAGGKSVCELNFHTNYAVFLPYIPQIIQADMS